MTKKDRIDCGKCPFITDGCHGFCMRAEQGGVYTFMGFFVLLTLTAICVILADRQAPPKTHSQRLEECASAGKIVQYDPLGKLACIKRTAVVSAEPEAHK